MKRLSVILLAACLALPASAQTVVPGGGAPSGAAGGDLSGTYPNPSVTKVNGASPTFATAPAATKSDQQTGTSATVVVTPLHQKDSDYAIKATAVVTQSGGNYTLAPAPDSVGIASISKSSTGVVVVTLSTAMASAVYAVVCSATQGAFVTVQENGGVRTASTFEVRVQSAASTFADSGFSCHVTGRQ